MTANTASEETEVTITELRSRYHLERTLDKLLSDKPAAVRAVAPILAAPAFPMRVTIYDPFSQKELILHSPWKMWNVYQAVAATLRTASGSGRETI